MLFSAIIVTGGMSYTSRKSVDILKEDGTHFCSLPDLPESRYSHTQSGLVMCGGFEGTQLKSCQTFSNGVWEDTHSNSLIQSRYDHSAWSSPLGIVLLGGHRSPTTTEVLTSDGESTEFFSLKYGIEYYYTFWNLTIGTLDIFRYACSIQLEKNVVITGRDHL